MKALLGTNLVVLALAGACAEAAVTAVWIGGSDLPVTIEALGTTISNNPHSGSKRFSINSSNEDVLFTRHIVSEEDNICYYWFRSTDDPGIWADTEEWGDVYWYVMEDCIFVDGAVDEDDNFVLLRNQAGEDIGVIQMRFSDAVDVDLPSPAQILAYAVDPNGLSFADAVAAIQAIPEPSTTMFGALALAGGLMRRRRRDGSEG